MRGPTASPVRCLNPSTCLCWHKSSPASQSTKIWAPKAPPNDRTVVGTGLTHSIQCAKVRGVHTALSCPLRPDWFWSQEALRNWLRTTQVQLCHNPAAPTGFQGESGGGQLGQAFLEILEALVGGAQQEEVGHWRSHWPLASPLLPGHYKGKIFPPPHTSYFPPVAMACHSLRPLGHTTDKLTHWGGSRQ